VWRITNFPQNQQFATHRFVKCGRNAGVWFASQSLRRCAPNGVGRNYLAAAAQVFDLVERVLRVSVDPPIPASAPARGALLTIFSSELLRLALGDVGDLLW
jgi:hypothetical protein